MKNDIYNDFVKMKLLVGGCKLKKSGNCATCPPELKRFCEQNAPEGEESLSQKIIRHMHRGLPVEYKNHRYIIISYNYGVWRGLARCPAHTTVELYDTARNSAMHCNPNELKFDIE